MTAMPAPEGDFRVSNQPRLTVVPCELAEANAFVARFHRHHQPLHRCKFNLAVADEGGTIRGVAMIGRPVARHRDDGWTLEVQRVCTDGTPNACSALYAASWRAAKAMGYRRLGTYILAAEPGTSLVAAGWKLLGEAGGGSWNHRSRPRLDRHPIGTKQIWEADVGDVDCPRSGVYATPPDKEKGPLAKEGLDNLDPARISLKEQETM